MTECWGDRPRLDLEPICYRECFIKYLINNIQDRDQGDGKIYSIVSLTEIFKRSINGGKRLKKRISKRRLIRNKRLSRNRYLKGGDIFRHKLDDIDNIYTKIDNGFKTIYNYYNEYLEPSIKINETKLTELGTKFRNPLSTVMFDGRTSQPKFINKSDLYSNTVKRELFNNRQTSVVPDGKFPIKSYTIKPPDLDNKICFYENVRPMTAFIRNEIVEAVAFSDNYLLSHDNIPVHIYKGFPIYFNISMPSSTHVVTLIKIGNKYYSFGFAFSDTSDTFSKLSDMTHLWDRSGSIFSPDTLFKIKPQEQMRLIDFGILRQTHIDKLNTYFGEITGIYGDYIESINLNADNTLNDDKKDGEIVLKNLQFITNKSRYFSFGHKPLSSTVYNNCASFTSNIFEDRITCACPLKKRLSLVIDNHPENCFATSVDTTQIRCQQLYQLFNSRIQSIALSDFKQIMNYT